MTRSPSFKATRLTCPSSSDAATVARADGRSFQSSVLCAKVCCRRAAACSIQSERSAVRSTMRTGETRFMSPGRERWLLVLLERPAASGRIDQRGVVLHERGIGRAVLLVARIALGGFRKCLAAVGVLADEIERP